jgi:hypothetical protein
LRIEIFYIDDCPNHRPTVERVNELLKQLGLAADVIEVPVTDSASALTYRFLGSPTVRINGIDVEPSARTSNQFGLMCRTYLEGQRRKGNPSRELIREALLEASNLCQGDMIEAL